MIKIFTKEDWVPPFADRLVFLLAPTIVVVVATLMSFAVVAFGPGIVVADLDVGLLFFLGMSSLGVYSPVLGGLGVEQQVRAAGRSACGGPDDQLRSVHGLVADGRGDAGRLVPDHRHRAGTTRPVVLRSASGGPGGVSSWPDWPRPAGCLSICPRPRTSSWPGYHTEYSGMKFGMFFVGEIRGDHA